MTWVGWLVEDWRLKLVALALAVLMLGAVAFSQNPPTTRTLSIPISYSVAPDIVILSPPTKTNVTFSGLSDVISNLGPNNFQANVDASKASPGNAVKLAVTASPLVGGVNVQSPPPIVVAIDTRKVIALTVQVNVPRVAPGYQIDPSKSVATCQGMTPCVVHFDGPQSWENGMKAYVTYPTPVNITDPSLPSQPIQLVTDSGPFDVTRQTQAPWTLDISTADIKIHATPGINSTTVPLNASPPSQAPPAAYEITGISVSPATVTITGDPAALAKIQRIILPAVDLSGATSTTTITVNIPFPDGISALDGRTQAKITYTIQRNPSVTPSP